MAIQRKCLTCGEWKDDELFRGPFRNDRKRRKNCRDCLYPPNREGRTARMMNHKWSTLPLVGDVKDKSEPVVGNASGLETDLVTVFRNDSRKNVTVAVELSGQLSTYRVLCPGDTLSIPKISADGCVVVLVS